MKVIGGRMSDIITLGYMLIECIYDGDECSGDCEGLQARGDCKYFGVISGGRPDACKKAEVMHETLGRAIGDLDKVLEVINQ
jgi:hypothetical protein